MNIISFSFPTTIHYGPRAISKIPGIIEQHGFTSALVVTDQALAKLEPCQLVLAEIEKSMASYEIFSGIWGNPVKSQVEAGVEAYKQAGANVIIALGGGAPVDVAKAIAVGVNHEGDLFDYEDIPGAKAIDKPLPPIIAIPTTAGTGSEVGRSAVIADDQTHIKKIIFAPGLLPFVALVDPVLTLQLPAGITAATGMDAITHLVEAYLATGYNPQCDGIALSGLRLAAQSLPACYKFASEKTGETEEHLKARGDMLNAAFMGAVAFQKGLGANHSCAHALSTVNDLHHGLANAVMLPYMMQFNSQIVPERFSDLEMMIGLERSGGKNFLSYIKDLNAELKIPTHLKEVDVKESDIEALVEVSLKDVCHSLNPGGPVSKENFTRVFEAAYG